MLLSGCTTYVTTQVTAFSDWSGNDATRTYAFTRAADQQNNLELTTYERFVANELATHAFRQVDASAGALSGRAVVRDSLGHGDGCAAGVLQPVAVAVLGPAVRSVGAVGPVGPYPTAYVNQSYPIFTHLLGVRITERASGKEVYNVTARNSDGESSLVRAMPYLARSALADFPLGNGVVHTVKIPVDKNGGVSNEVATTGAAPAAAPASASGAKAVQ